MSEALGSCIGLISLGVAITVIVFTVRIYNDTKQTNPLNFYDEILHKENQLSFDGPPQDPVLNDLGKYCQCGEEILNNICSEEQIISGCYDVSKKDEKALIRRLSDLNCDSINKDLDLGNHNYSEKLMQIIFKMIESDENKRYDFIELEKELNEFFG